eukprot:scaffold70749_cov62-Phaeocystis_antarctica.AAC.7
MWVRASPLSTSRAARRPSPCTPVRGACGVERGHQRRAASRLASRRTGDCAPALPRRAPVVPRRQRPTAPLPPAPPRRPRHARRPRRPGRTRRPRHPTPPLPPLPPPTPHRSPPLPPPPLVPPPPLPRPRLRWGA